jgi:mono/diheme cytochrome c family protein
MNRPLFSLLAWTLFASSSAAAGPGPEKLVSPPEVDLPFGDADFPKGPGSQAISDNCVACHSADHVLNQPSLSKENWEEVVHKMVRSYKAPISAEEQEKIVDYLASTKGRE